MNNDLNLKSIRNMNWLWTKLNAWKPLLFDRPLWCAFIHFSFFYSVRTLFFFIFGGRGGAHGRAYGEWMWKSLVPTAWNSFIRSSVLLSIGYEKWMTMNILQISKSISFILSNTPIHNLLYCISIIIIIVLYFFMPFHFLQRCFIFCLYCRSSMKLYTMHFWCLNHFMSIHFPMATSSWKMKWYFIQMLLFKTYSTSLTQKRCNFALVPHEQNKR